MDVESFRRDGRARLLREVGRALGQEGVDRLLVLPGAVGGGEGDALKDFANADSDKYKAMIESIRKQLHLTSLKYQRLDDLVRAIGLPKDRLCTYCWDGAE